MNLILKRIASLATNVAVATFLVCAASFTVFRSGFWYLCLFALFFCGTVYALKDRPPFGVCLEKYYYPPFQCLNCIEVKAGEGHVPEDASPKVYLIKPDVRPFPEQWIVKIGWTNGHGKPQPAFVKVPKETWLANHPGQMFSGPILQEPPRGL